MNTSYTHGF